MIVGVKLLCEVSIAMMFYTSNTTQEKLIAIFESNIKLVLTNGKAHWKQGKINTLILRTDRKQIMVSLLEMNTTIKLQSLLKEMMSLLEMKQTDL
jgi:hypothetical protein